MQILRLTALTAALALAGTAMAQDLPDYYPENGFQRTGSIDSVQFEAQRIVIDDIAYTISSSVVVHSPRSYSVPATKLRIGARVGYKLASGGRVIAEIWLLPGRYPDDRRRR